MTGLILFIAFTLLIVVALEVTHRRALRPWRPGLDERSDRDAARLEAELRAIGQREPRSAATPDPIHLVPPRSAATDPRLTTRTAA
jgi:hypothetical protein